MQYYYSKEKMIPPSGIFNLTPPMCGFDKREVTNTTDTSVRGLPNPSRLLLPPPDRQPCHS